MLPHYHPYQARLPVGVDPWGVALNYLMSAVCPSNPNLNPNPNLNLNLNPNPNPNQVRRLSFGSGDHGLLPLPRQERAPHSLTLTLNLTLTLTSAAPGTTAAQHRSLIAPRAPLPPHRSLRTAPSAPHLVTPLTLHRSFYWRSPL